MSSRPWNYAPIFSGDWRWCTGSTFLSVEEVSFGPETLDVGLFKFASRVCDEWKWMVDGIRLTTVLRIACSVMWENGKSPHHDGLTTAWTSDGFYSSKTMDSLWLSVYLTIKWPYEHLKTTHTWGRYRPKHRKGPKRTEKRVITYYIPKRRKRVAEEGSKNKDQQAGN